MFDGRGVFAGERVELLRDGANHRDHVVVGKHGGYGDEEARHRRDERARHARRHGREAGGVGFRDAREGLHDAPNGAQQADERPSGYRR